ncbi:MAG: transglutaminase domain-containing protein [Pseudomonadota bacterium]
MKTPFLLLGASLLFWGWQTGLWPLALVMVLLLEGSRFVKSRLDLSPSDFNRISDLCSLLLLGMFIYLFASHRSAGAILALLQWLPMAFFPLLLAQIYSTSEEMDIGALFLIFRIERVKQENIFPTAMNLTYPYFGLCILSASTANVRTLWFYVGLFLLSAWALWFFRSTRYSPVIWIGPLLCAGLMGYVGQMGLHRLQVILEEKALGLFTSFTGQDGDPYRVRTAIGELGSLKLSDRILFRVNMEPPHEAPLLLREASYNLYNASVWFASQAPFKAVQPEGDGKTWKLRSDPGNSRAMTISCHLKRGKGLLKLPNGTFEIARLPVLVMQRNPLGTVKVEEGPGLINYQVHFRKDSPFDSPPDEKDLLVPPRELHALSHIIQEFQITSESPQKTLKRVADFFQKNFKYSLTLKNGEYLSAPLEGFLVHTRAGHCEYFATATVLLLRAAGIPARYTTGYSVQEYSKLEDLFIVRSRHAHSWSLVYMDGGWHDFDTTPSSWISIEEKGASILQPLSDLWSWCMFRISKWRWRENGGGLTKHAVWLLIPLVFLLVKRLYSRGRVKRSEKENRRGVVINPGSDSEFYLVEKRLKESGYERYPWETPSCWIRRIEETYSEIGAPELLQTVLDLHYRYRFDPWGITSEDRISLKSKVRSWLELHEGAEKEMGLSRF